MDGRMDCEVWWAGITLARCTLSLIDSCIPVSVGINPAHVPPSLPLSLPSLSLPLPSLSLPLSPSLLVYLSRGAGHTLVSRRAG